MKRLLLAVALVLTLTGCSNVRNERVTDSNIDSVTKDVSNSKLSDEDKAAFATAIMKGALGAGETTTGKTVGQIIDQEKQLEATAQDSPTP
jgi:thymidine phosphorylase